MPVYDYKCEQHGVFAELATMDSHAAPAPCPQCRQLSPRVIMLAPEILERSPKFAAMERNEKAQHVPSLSTNDSRAESRERAKHRCGCGHDHDRPISKLMYTADGKKMFPSMRPWMISH